jgi:hypothetical protein
VLSRSIILEVTGEFENNELGQSLKGNSERKESVRNGGVWAEIRAAHLLSTCRETYVNQLN